MTSAVKNLIHKHAQNFANANKQFLKDQKIQQEELETVLIGKDEISESDHIKREYFEKIDDLRKRALRLFKVKN